MKRQTETNKARRPSKRKNLTPYQTAARGQSSGIKESEWTELFNLKANRDLLLFYLPPYLSWIKEAANETDNPFISYGLEQLEKQKSAPEETRASLIAVEWLCLKRFTYDSLRSLGNLLTDIVDLSCAILDVQFNPTDTYQDALKSIDGAVRVLNRASLLLESQGGALDEKLQALLDSAKAIDQGKEFAEKDLEKVKYGMKFLESTVILDDFVNKYEDHYVNGKGTHY